LITPASILHDQQAGIEPCADAALLRMSPLEFLHPNGCISSALVIGRNCPPALLPSVAASNSGAADLVVVAPAEDEYRSAGWLARAASALTQRLAADGVGYLLLPPLQRLSLIRLLRQQRLLIDGSIAHIPDWASSRHLIPLDAIAGRFAVARLIPMHAWRRRLVLAALYTAAGRALLAAVLPSVGVIVRHPDARPLSEWLTRFSGQHLHNAGAIISTSRRGPRETSVVYHFSGSVAQVAKLALGDTNTGDIIAEAALLARAGRAAGRAGAQVPLPVQLGSVADRPVMIQAAVRGRPAALVLADSPDRLFAVIERIVGWLEQWNHLTAVVQPLDWELLQREVLDPASILSPLLPQGGAYYRWLQLHCEAVLGVQTPLVATHNDLTMWNVLVDARTMFGVVDWESARLQGLPLVDFFYALADALAATDGYTNRLASFEMCSFPGHPYAAQVANLQLKLCRMLRLTDAVAEICLHACWLRHAANEQRLSRAGDQRPFLQIIQRLSAATSTGAARPAYDAA
jgi:hypothetical protein